MRRDILELDTSISRSMEPLRLSLEDVEALRVLLAGGSVVDWHKAAFADLASVDRLLRLHLMDPDDPQDQARLRYLFDEAASYVEEYLQLRIPPKLREVEDVRDIFLWASNAQGFRRTQVLSCMILKLMHVLQHLEAADLRQHLSISDQELQDAAHALVANAADRMRRSGVPLVAFHGNRKSRMSVISKLLSKRDDVAARIFDKLRYRVIVPQETDVVAALSWLVREVFPYNQIIPGQSRNNLLDPRALADALTPEEREQLQALVDDPVRADTPTNEFSGRNYRMINFVTDIPIALPPDKLPDQDPLLLGRTVYVTVEFQLVDEQTAKDNEEGDNAHSKYKRRQFERVRDRLTRGQYLR